MAKETSTLSVRIDVDTFREFNEYTKKHHLYTQAGIVDRLIKYFMNQSEEQRQFLVMGVGTNYVDLLGEALQLVTWGDHAFNGYRHISSIYRSSRGSYLPWVIEIYNELDSISKGTKYPVKEADTSSRNDDLLTGILSLRRIAWFKLGAAWIALAGELRKQALLDLAGLFSDGTLQQDTATPESKVDDWTVLYDAAVDSLRVAVANYGLFNQSLEQFKKEPHRIVLYNQACTWSLIAQYITEQTATNQELHPFAMAEWQNEENRKVTDEPELCLISSGNVEADKALRKANDCLKHVTINFMNDADGETEDMPFADAQWLFDYAKVDSDIAFYRNCSKEEFGKWLDRRKGISLLDSYKGFRRKLPEDIKNFMASEFSDD
jgi:hypothetical protein